MKPIIASLSDSNPLLHSIAQHLDIETAELTVRHFPDGETYIRFHNDLRGREVIILSSLDYPDAKILPILFIAETAKELGARRVGLCAPYLAYMRQDKLFNAGECVTSRYFARLISQHFDWLITVDPHLHRYKSLDEIYTIPNTVLHAAPQISEWIAENVNNPILIGPDSESEQWISHIANKAAIPYLILEKIRHGDQNVEVSKPEIESYLECQPVLVDDIISTARTMIETLKHLNKIQLKPAICIGVHAIFAQDSYQNLLEMNINQVITCNTIQHISNQIDCTKLLSEGIIRQLSP